VNGELVVQLTVSAIGLAIVVAAIVHVMRGRR